MLLISSIVIYAQEDVTKFLGIPVDGSKSEMIQKLKAKGYTSSQHNKDILVGEFNGTDVNIHIAKDFSAYDLKNIAENGVATKAKLTIKNAGGLSGYDCQNIASANPGNVTFDFSE